MNNTTMRIKVLNLIIQKATYLHNNKSSDFPNFCFFLIKFPNICHSLKLWKIPLNLKVYTKTVSKYIPNNKLRDMCPYML
jgi:hypothetical protein